MNFKSPSMIVVYVLSVISITSFALITVQSFFSIVGSVGLTLVFIILTWNSWIDYLVYKRKKADERLSDAYLYAEKLGDEEAIKNFSYDKKTERKLKFEKFSHYLIPLTFLTLALFGICLIVICIRII